MERYAMLRFVDEVRNHNKFYEMKLNSDRSIDVRYGREGNNGVTKHYRPYERDYEDLYWEKRNKGYTDVSALYSKKEHTGKTYDSYKPVEDTKVNEVLSFLYSSSRQFFKDNYNISIHTVTQKMIDEAEEDLRQLSRCADFNLSLYAFKDTLKKLFTDIPRKMTKVSDYMPTDSSDFEKIIERETQMLNNVKGQYAQMLVEQKTGPQTDETITETFGIKMERATYEEEDKVISSLGVDYDGKPLEQRFVTCYKVTNNKTEQDFNKFCKDFKIKPDTIRHFYHGSKVENWLSITTSGLLLNPDASTTGKMFGQGLYFAGEDELRKSLNYMDVKGARWNDGQRETGFTAIFKVALGKCYMPHRALPCFNYRDLKDGCTSVYAEKSRCGLRNDEYIVYRQEQCTIEYLMEIRAYAKPMNLNLHRSQVRNSVAKGFSSLTKIPEGVRAEFDVMKVSAKCADELSKYIDFAEYQKIYIDYNNKRDTISFAAIDGNGNSIDFVPRLTNDDKAFLMREMKKSFVKSEPEWEKLMETASKTRTGKEIISRPEKNHERT